MLGAWSPFHFFLLPSHFPRWVLGYPAPLALGTPGLTWQSQLPLLPQGIQTWGSYTLQHPGQRIDDSIARSAGNKAGQALPTPIQVPGASWHQKEVAAPLG